MSEDDPARAQRPDSIEDRMAAIEDEIAALQTNLGGGHGFAVDGLVAANEYDLRHIPGRHRHQDRRPVVACVDGDLMVADDDGKLVPVGEIRHYSPGDSRGHAPGVPPRFTSVRHHDPPRLLPAPPGLCAAFREEGKSGKGAAPRLVPAAALSVNRAGKVDLLLAVSRSLRLLTPPEYVSEIFHRSGTRLEYLGSRYHGEPVAPELEDAA